MELLEWWQRDGRQRPLFFAQREAAETIIFLNEARADFRQGITVPREEVGPDREAEGYKGFLRYACKMATGSGKTTVMGMIAAWSILTKIPQLAVRDTTGEERAKYLNIWEWILPKLTPAERGGKRANPKRLDRRRGTTPGRRCSSWFARIRRSPR